MLLSECTDGVAHILCESAPKRVDAARHFVCEHRRERLHPKHFSFKFRDFDCASCTRLRESRTSDASSPVASAPSMGQGVGSLHENC